MSHVRAAVMNGTGEPCRWDFASAIPPETDLCSPIETLQRT